MSGRHRRLQRRDVLIEAQRLKYHELRWGQTATR